MTTAPKCGSRRAPTMTSASPWIIGCTEKPSSPASSPRGAERSSISRAAARTASAPARPRRTAPTSLLCTIRRDTALSTTGVPSAVAAAAAASGVGAVIVSARHRHAVRREQPLDLALGQRAVGKHERARIGQARRAAWRGVDGAARRASCSATSARTRSASSVRSK